MKMSIDSLYTGVRTMTIETDFILPLSMEILFT